MLSRYPVRNVLGQRAKIVPTCPAIPTTPGLNCQRTPNGGVICSDGTYFPPGCTNLPPITTPGVSTYVREEGLVRVATPPPFSLAQETGEGFPYLPVGIAVAGIFVAIFF